MEIDSYALNDIYPEMKQAMFASCEDGEARRKAL